MGTLPGAVWQRVILLRGTGTISMEGVNLFW